MVLSVEKIRERFKDLLENPHYFIFVYRLDGNLIDVNEAILEHFGYTREEVIDTPFRKYINNEDLEMAFKSIEQFRKTKTFAGANIYRIRKKDGEYLYVEVFGIPIKDDMGEISAVLALGYDVTKFKISEQKLKESEQKFRTIADQSLIGIVILQDNLIKYANQKFADISGYPLEEIFNWKPGELFKIVHPKDKQKVIEQATKKMQGETEVINHYNFIGIRKNGEQRWIEIHSKTITYENQFADLVIVVDVTEKRGAELKLKESEEKYKKAYIKESFYKDLFAHDMNNILQNMIMTLELNELNSRGIQQNEIYFEFIQNFKEQIERATILVKNVNTFSELDEKSLKFKKMDLKQIIKKVSLIPSKTKDGRTINLDINIQNGDFIILADDFIYNVFENLINNAIKHNNNLNINIEINAYILQKNGRDFIKVEIIDNGKGIPDSKKDSIFSRGLNGDRSVRGMGLGLSLAKAILNHYNAEIYVENKDLMDVTKGSNFIILFPRGV